MIIGKTSSSISPTEIFTKYTETQILCAVFPEITQLPCKICSPLRKDEHPSFSIYINNGGHVAWKDHAKNNERGGLMDLLCKYWNCTFNQALEKIIQLPQFREGVIISPKQVRTLTRKEVDTLTKIEVKVRPWRDYDIEYWESYGITKPWLVYAEVYPTSFKIITKKDRDTGKTSRYVFPADKYCYTYVERKEGNLQLKIYSPFNTKGFKWCSKMDASVISLWTKVPEYGDRVIISSSVKDALVLSCQLHIPAISPQGEGYGISGTAVSELKRRYKKVFISYDGDKTGVEDAKKLSKTTGFSIIYCPKLRTPLENNTNVERLIKEGLKKKDEAKDWSDIYLYFGRDRLIEEFNKAASF